MHLTHDSSVKPKHGKKWGVSLIPRETIFFPWRDHPGIWILHPLVRSRWNLQTHKVGPALLSMYFPSRECPFASNKLGLLLHHLPCPWILSCDPDKNLVTSPVTFTHAVPSCWDIFPPYPHPHTCISCLGPNSICPTNGYIWGSQAFPCEIWLHWSLLI